jgi:uncharacterized membrane protein
MTHGDTPRSSVLLWAPVGLAALGILVAGYLTVKRLGGGSLACTRWAQCDVVNSSPYATIGGVPVAFIGLAGYLLLFGLAAVAVQAQAEQRRQILWASFLLSAGGLLFSIYLTYLEVSVIQALCIWCLASAIIILLLALVGGLNLRRAGAPGPECGPGR